MVSDCFFELLAAVGSMTRSSYSQISWHQDPFKLLKMTENVGEKTLLIMNVYYQYLPY